MQRAVEVIFAGVVFVVYAGGDWMPLWRFMVPIVPVLAYCMGRGLVVVWNRIMVNDPEYKLRDALMLGIALLLCLSIWQERRATFYIMYSVSEGSFYRPNIAAGAWLDENAPEDVVVAGEEAGIIPFYSGHRFIDMIGIVDAHIARVQGAMHEKVDPEYVLSRKPDFIVLICGRPVGEFMAEPIAMFKSGKELMARDEFSRLYEPVHRIPRGNKYIGSNQLVIFKRKQ
jgi:hypothetical protein